MSLGTICHRILAPDAIEATFERRGFRAKDPAAQELLERIGIQFLKGLEYGMTSRDLAQAAGRLESVERESRGFAYEGAAMALAILDALAPASGIRLRAFIDGPAASHVYMAHVGAGWAMARLPWPLRARVRLLDPLLGNLALDGWGFHEAYFRTGRVVGGHARPGPGGHVPDQGVGRALWFVCGADPAYLAATIGGFEPGRHADLWAGAGLAATYAGGADEADLRRLAGLAGPYRADLAQGSAFAAKARLLADLVTDHTAVAVGVLCETGVAQAAERTDQAMPADPRAPDAYAAWRRAVRDSFSIVRDSA